MSKFEVGQRVVDKNRSDLETYNEYGAGTVRGVVVSIFPNEPNKVKVKWDESWCTPNPAKVSDDDLLPEEEANKILSQLEDEYEAWAGPIRAKLEQAGNLLKEAGELSAKNGRELTDSYELVRPLLRAMDEVGWNTSSLNC